MYFLVRLALLFALPICMATFYNSGPSAVKLITLDGYPLERHTVTTEDGYILELHRIPHGRNETNSRGIHKKIVFFGPCIFCSSSAYVMLGPTRGLAYMVVNAGYDVWLMNGRGNRHSQRHVKLSPHSDEFWKFSWHEHGMMDVSTSIDYVLKLTGESQLDYIGYSMGTSMFFVLVSERPEYNAKIRSMVAIAPPVFVNTALGLVPSITPHVNPISGLFADFKKLSFPPPDLRLNDKLSIFCGSKISLLFGIICDTFLISIGAKSVNVDRRNYPFIFSIFPGYASVRAIVHFAQLRNSGNFQKFSFGRKINMVKYGSPYPPTYNLSNVIVPISVFGGGRDTYVTTAGVKKLIETLPNVEYSKVIPSYDHFDFIWAKNAHRDVYEAVVQRIKRQDSPNCCQSTSKISVNQV